MNNVALSEKKTTVCVVHYNNCNALLNIVPLRLLRKDLGLKPSSSSPQPLTYMLYVYYLGGPRYGQAEKAIRKSFGCIVLS